MGLRLVYTGKKSIEKIFHNFPENLENFESFEKTTFKVLQKKSILSWAKQLYIQK